MPYRKFGKNDININTMKAHPRSEFFIYDSKIYYNNQPARSGSFANNVLGDLSVYVSASSGFISLYEYNIDVPTYGLISSGNLPYRGGATPGMATYPGASERDSLRTPIYPYISKDSSRLSLKISTVLSGTIWDNEFLYGDLLTGSYPQWASIKREYITTPSSSGQCTTKWNCGHNMSYFSLKNLLNLYGTLSPHYFVESSYGSGWNKDTQELNLIHIPSIFYGEKIRPGTVKLKWLLTGSNIGTLQDSKENGELIQTGPVGSPGSGSVAGVVLYNEGFILLTGSWALNDEYAGIVLSEATTGASATSEKPQWIYWGAGARDNLNNTNTAHSGSASGKGPLTGYNISDTSFLLTFEGETTTQTLTLYARAKRGQVNYSNNPTFLQRNQKQLQFTSSHVYEEYSKRLIKNTVSSSYSDYSASFKRQVYISKIAVYDEDKNIIGIASMASPVLKKEDQELTFKIKLDI